MKNNIRRPSLIITEKFLEVCPAADGVKWLGETRTKVAPRPWQLEENESAELTPIRFRIEVLNWRERTPNFQNHRDMFATYWRWPDEVDARATSGKSSSVKLL